MKVGEGVTLPPPYHQQHLKVYIYIYIYIYVYKYVYKYLKTVSAELQSKMNS
jgi:hypothetical protein